jgi:hypothetical protein
LYTTNNTFSNPLFFRISRKYKQNLADEEQYDEITLLQRAWRVADERNSLVLQQLQNEFKVMTMKTEAQIGKVKQEEIQRAERDIAYHK